ncbi:MAG: hypothetical protein Fues2KO_52460 [Fuerstiella sp.]
MHTLADKPTGFLAATQSYPVDAVLLSEFCTERKTDGGDRGSVCDRSDNLTIRVKKMTCAVSALSQPDFRVVCHWLRQCKS